MPTAITHAFVALAAGKIAYGRRLPWKSWTLAMACSAGPDLDVGLFAYGVKYEDAWGHRGMSHSLLFALVLAFIVTLVFFRDRDTPIGGRRWWGLVAFFFIITASHGLLDAFTNGGLGIAFLAPFDNTRYFFPWNPIEVAHIGARSLFTRDGVEVLLSEMKWIWLPLTCLAAFAILIRRWGGRAKPTSD